MRKLNLIKTSFATALMLAVMFTGCKKADPPTVDFIGTVDGYDVLFTVEDTGVDSYAWDYGDGTTSTEAGSHTYTYAASGEYTVKLVVTGEGGDAEKTIVVEVLPDNMELLTGGVAATNGKTWQMSTTVTLGYDGASDITPPNYDSWVATMGGVPFGNNVLAQIGLDAEYDNLYTFKHDGTMSVDPVNGNAIAGGVYSVVNQSVITINPGVGLNMIEYTAVSGMGFSLSTGDLAMDIVTEVEGSADVESSVSDPGVDMISFTGGGFIGLIDFPTTAVIRSIHHDRMVVTVFMHGAPNTPLKPSVAITVTFDAVD